MRSLARTDEDEHFFSVRTRIHTHTLAALRHIIDEITMLFGLCGGYELFTGNKVHMWLRIRADAL